jgi:predicted NBD/HSP70 family sugar kinase
MLVAVDTGGTKTLVAVFGQDGTVKDSVKFPTPSSSTEYITQLTEAIHSMLAGSKPEIICLALPDITKVRPFGYEVDRFSHLTWRHFNPVDALRDHFPNTEIIAGNDANLGGLGEVRSMKKIPARALYVTISTGVGTGVIINGKLDNDFMRTEGGHLLLEYNGTLQDWDSFGSGKAIYDTYQRPASEITSPRIWKQIVDRMSRGLFVLIPIVKPEVIVIGGSIGTHFEKYGQHLVDLLTEKLPVTIDMPHIIQAQHPEEAVIYGCYYYAIDKLATQ